MIHHRDTEEFELALKLQFPASLGKLDLSFSLVRNGALVTSEIVASLVISLFSVSLCSLGGEWAAAPKTKTQPVGLV